MSRKSIIIFIMSFAFVLTACSLRRPLTIEQLSNELVGVWEFDRNLLYPVHYVFDADGTGVHGNQNIASIFYWEICEERFLRITIVGPSTAFWDIDITRNRLTITSRYESIRGRERTEVSSLTRSYIRVSEQPEWVDRVDRDRR